MMGHREWPRGICSAQKTQVGCGGSLNDDLDQNWQRDPILLQQYYLDARLQKELCDDYGIKSYRPIERPRDTVLARQDVHTRYLSQGKIRVNDETTPSHINARA